MTGFDGAASGYKRQIRYIDVAGQLEMVGQLQRGQYSRLDWRAGGGGGGGGGGGEARPRADCSPRALHSPPKMPPPPTAPGSGRLAAKTVLTQIFHNWQSWGPPGPDF